MKIIKFYPIKVVEATKEDEENLKRMIKNYEANPNNEKKDVYTLAKTDGKESDYLILGYTAEEFYKSLFISNEDFKQQGL